MLHRSQVLLTTGGILIRMEDTQPASIRVNISMSPKHLQRLKSLATIEEITRSELIRRLIDSAYGDVTEQAAQWGAAQIHD